MGLFKNIIYFILSVQEKILTAKLNKTLGAKTNSRRKRVYGNGYLLSLDSLADGERTRMEEEIALILKSSNYDPSEALEYIKKHDTKVYYIENARYLHSIGENEGFIYPQTGARAIYLSLLTEKKAKLKTDGMFVLTKGEINKYYFIYHFYNWYAFKHNVSGIDSDSVNMLNKCLYNATEEEISSLQLEDIYKLKDAIKQDKSAIEFVFKLCQNIEGAQKAFEKMQNDGAQL